MCVLHIIFTNFAAHFTLNSNTIMSNKQKTPTSQTPFVELPLSELQPNTGQIDGLPQNPRYITEEKMELLKSNIQQYPEMLQYRSLLVYRAQDKRGGAYIVIGGNMRLRALQALGYETAPCVIIPQGTPIERLQAYAILDNNGFGKYDWDILANEWDTAQLEEWGVDLPVPASDVDIDDFFNSANGEEKDKDLHLMVILPAELKEQKDEIKSAIEAALTAYNGITIK